MVLRKTYDSINKVGRIWMNLNQGTYTNVSQADKTLEQARVLLEDVVADWPEGVPDTQAVRAAREYLQRSGDGEQ